MKKVLFVLSLLFVSISFQSCTDESEQAQELHQQAIEPGNDGSIDDEDYREED